ncbi:MAG: helix-turn-helix domain-containing protein [Proteobacteria bacterium]|nr:helix-turn-helix domain-containing protein [Pseudomonadota bacterium]
MYSVALLAVQNCMYSSLVGPLDIFSVASNQAGRLAAPVTDPLFQAVIVGPEKRKITAFNGMPIPLGATFTAPTVYDIVFVPVIFGDLEAILADSETIHWLKDQGRMGACLCSACAGSFLVAETGRLNGRTATTHWNLADSFVKRFPEVTLKREKMLVDAGDCITAGGVTAYLDLSLYLAARFGSPELAALLSKILLIDPARRLQSPYQSSVFSKNHDDEVIRMIQEWLEADPGQRGAIADLAGRARLGERTFSRRFKKATGDSPLEYLQRLRIEAARKLLETTAESIEEITIRAGYEDISSFRKLFKRHTGLSPSAYRKRFSCRLSVS